MQSTDNQFDVPEVEELDPLGVLADVYDEPGSGRWLVGFRTDARVAVYDENDGEVELIDGDLSVQSFGLGGFPIETWVHDACIDNLFAELHPRYLWLVKMARGDYGEDGRMS